MNAERGTRNAKLINRRAFTAAVLLLLGIFPSLSAAPELEEILKKMEQAEKATTDLQFAFRQDVHFGATEEAQHYEGKILFKPPQKLKVEYSKPLAQQIISDGDKIWIYTPTMKQAIEDSWGHWQEKGLLPNGLLSFSEKIQSLRDNYHIRLISQNDQEAWLEFVPKAKELTANRLKILVSLTDYLPRKTEFSTGQFKSVTHLKDLKSNKGLKDELFRFKPPAGVAVERFQ